MELITEHLMGEGFFPFYSLSRMREHTHIRMNNVLFGSSYSLKTCKDLVS